jgi:hypothetical protein
VTGLTFAPKYGFGYSMRKLRQISEEEVVAQFLKHEFYQEEFHRDREQFESLVMNPDLNNPAEAVIRRALLLRRRRNVWLELPPDTQWFEVEIERKDLPKMRVFTRGHWAKMTRDNHHLVDFVERARTHRLSRFAYRHMTKVQSVRYRLRDSTEVSPVFLIGIDENSPITIMEGNNRLTAVLLDSFDLWQRRFRFYVGLSPQMGGYVFYECNWANFISYAFRALRRKLSSSGNTSPPLEQESLRRSKSAESPDWSLSAQAGIAQERTK